MKRMLGRCGLFIVRGVRRTEGEVGSLRWDVEVRLAALRHREGNSGWLLCGVTCFLSFLASACLLVFVVPRRTRKKGGKKWANEKRRKKKGLF